MRRSLSLLAVTALLLAAPASAQYMFLDMNQDGVCNTDDALVSAVTSVDIWLDTNHNRDGSLAACDEGSYPLSIYSYEFILHASGSGTVRYGAYTNARSEMTTQVGPVGINGTTDYWIGFGGATIDPPGLYKLGSLAVAVTGTPLLSIMPSTTIWPVANTAFGSQCVGKDFDNTLKLFGTQNGTGDWTDVCALTSLIPVRATTWGVIKNMYK